MMNLIFILCRPFNIQGKEHYLRDLFFILKTTTAATTAKTFNVGLYSDICGLISFKLGMMAESTKLYILISVWMTLTSFKVTVV